MYTISWLSYGNALLKFSCRGCRTPFDFLGQQDLLILSLVRCGYCI